MFHKSIFKENIKPNIVALAVEANTIFLSLHTFVRGPGDAKYKIKLKTTVWIVKNPYHS